MPDFGIMSSDGLSISLSGIISFVEAISTIVVVYVFYFRK